MYLFNRGLQLSLGLLLGSSLTLTACDEITGVDECQTALACVIDGDCPDGSHCNTALNPPKCQNLYCGATGSQCSEPALCAEQLCSDGLCMSARAEDGMILIPSGSFWMGCDESSGYACADDSEPYHEVMMSGYYMDQTEVTQKEYKKCVDAGECAAPGCDWDPVENSNKPVVCMRWSDALAYCSWAGKQLPTEAQWEKASRGTDGREYPWGYREGAICDYVVTKANGEDGCGTGETMEVCSKSPAGDSPYGLCDMSGNVWEWVSDWYDRDYYDRSPLSNPKGPNSGSQRVIRGGGFSGYDWDPLKTWARGYDNPSDNIEFYDNLGFRCARPQ